MDVPRSFTTYSSTKVNKLINEVGVARAYSEGDELPTQPNGKFRALWDTGATNSVITANVVAQCNLEPTGMTRVSTANGTHDTQTFFVSLWLPNHVIIPHMRVTLAQLESQGIDILIGMDVIGEGDFAVNCYNGKTSFSYRYPSIEQIDYSKPSQYIRVSPKVGRNDNCWCGSGKKFKNCHGKEELVAKGRKPPF